TSHEESLLEREEIGNTHDLHEAIHGVLLPSLDQLNPKRLEVSEALRKIVQDTGLPDTGDKQLLFSGSQTYKVQLDPPISGDARVVHHFADLMAGKVSQFMANYYAAKNILLNIDKVEKPLSLWVQGFFSSMYFTDVALSANAAIT